MKIVIAPASFLGRASSAQDHHLVPSIFLLSESSVILSTAVHSVVMPDHPTASWQAMQDGNVFYRRQQLYSVSGKFPDFADYITAGCRYGGPIGALYVYFYLLSVLRECHGQR